MNGASSVLVVMTLIGLALGGTWSCPLGTWTSYDDKAQVSLEVVFTQSNSSVSLVSIAAANGCYLEFTGYDISVNNYTDIRVNMDESNPTCSQSITPKCHKFHGGCTGVDGIQNSDKFQCLSDSKLQFLGHGGAVFTFDRS